MTRHMRYEDEGLPGEIADLVEDTNPATNMALDRVDERFRPLDEGQILSVGGRDLRTVVVPGHTPGNAMFWLEKQGVMFTGDHILFDISPNITCWPEVEDSLGNYLTSLRRARAFPVRQALPGHRHAGDYHARIQELLEHHAFRLREAERIVRDAPGQTAYEITGHMQRRIRARNWAEFPPVQKWFALGECIAHLDYLLKRNRVRKVKDGGVWRYEPGPEDGTESGPEEAEIEKGAGTHDSDTERD